MLTIIGSCSAISNGLSRAGWATLMDKYGFKKLFCGLMVVYLVCIGSIGYIGSRGWAYFIIVCATQCSNGGMFSCFPAITSKIYGNKVESFNSYLIGRCCNLWNTVHFHWFG